MKALYDQKVIENKSGEQIEGMDIMGSLVKGQGFDMGLNPSQSEKGQIGLTESNVLGNSFVMLLGMFTMHKISWIASNI